MADTNNSKLTTLNQEQSTKPAFATDYCTTPFTEYYTHFMTKHLPRIHSHAEITKERTKH